MSKRLYSVHLVATRLCEGWVDVGAETEQEALDLAQTSPYMAKVKWELVDYLDYEADGIEDMSDDDGLGDCDESGAD